MKAGFIGLGIMGSRMAANLLKKGHSLTVFNRTRARAGELLAGGAQWAASPAALAGNGNGNVEVLFTMLAHPEAVREAALGADGFLQHLPSGALWVDCSSVNPSFSRDMAAAAKSCGVHFVDAPVSGSKIPAAEGKLIFWVGGEEMDLTKCRPLLECMGNKIVHMGKSGMGAAMKMVVNQLLGSTMAAFAESMVLGEALGLDRKVLFESLLGTPITAPFLASKRAKMETGDYEADFPLRWVHKDLQLVSVSAYEAGVAMPLGHATKEIYALAIRAGLGTADFSAVYDYLGRKREDK
jgi:3-hydroxyisobutyrate dehydrogenase-like beta-hydroxyacid dehydrogenase